MQRLAKTAVLSITKKCLADSDEFEKAVDSLDQRAPLRKFVRAMEKKGLFKKDAAEYLAEVSAKNPADIPEDIKELAEKRWQAKLARDWASADKLRAELDEKGYVIKDAKDNYTVIKK